MSQGEPLSGSGGGPNPKSPEWVFCPAILVYLSVASAPYLCVWMKIECKNLTGQCLWVLLVLVWILHLAVSLNSQQLYRVRHYTSVFNSGKIWQFIWILSTWTGTHVSSISSWIWTISSWTGSLPSTTSPGLQNCHPTSNFQHLGQKTGYLALRSKDCTLQHRVRATDFAALGQK